LNKNIEIFNSTIKTLKSAPQDLQNFRKKNTTLLDENIDLKNLSSRDLILRRSTERRSLGI
jgi:hypothetical protein